MWTASKKLFAFRDPGHFSGPFSGPEIGGTKLNQFSLGDPAAGGRFGGQKVGSVARWLPPWPGGWLGGRVPGSVARWLARWPLSVSLNVSLCVSLCVSQSRRRTKNRNRQQGGLPPPGQPRLRNSFSLSETIDVLPGGAARAFAWEAISLHIVARRPAARMNFHERGPTVEADGREQTGELQQRPGQGREQQQRAGQGRGQKQRQRDVPSSCVAHGSLLRAPR